ncbi:protein FAM184A-like isoform X1 [Mytilus californianus]|uniref:protein FAM184A-like isoform X1 n=1 Tax=Mytilus californianus TaxID=6549 RepID=UPI002246D156|nr:protein FAM184A-like isoform X1 [Mytilus californianus]XP_052100842.1 protein FAM184A-like isoform X1 [Mytilus californianus]
MNQFKFDSGDSAKKTFEFRMSKKVSELTQVVHMLFTRNHEKEVEIEAMKEAFEYEILLVQEDAQNRIDNLETKRLELELELDRERKAGQDRLKSALKNEADSREEEWKAKLIASEKNLLEEKSECQNLRDLLINAQRDIEKLRQGVADQLASKNEEILRKNQELDKLRKLVANLEKTQVETETHYKEIIRDLEKTNEKLEKELQQLQALLEETHRNKMKLEEKNAKLETDLKNLRKDFSRKVAEVVASQKMQHHQQLQQVQSHQQPSTRLSPGAFTREDRVRSSRSPIPSNSAKRRNSRDSRQIAPKRDEDYNDELEKLRREVQRYRMELSNRDSNFNRVFSTQQPLTVDPRAGKIGMSSQQVIASHRSNEPLLSKEKSFSYAFVQSIDESKRPSSSRASSAASRLPVLSQEQKNRLTKLMRPKPLSKEALYSK